MFSKCYWKELNYLHLALFVASGGGGGAGGRVEVRVWASSHGLEPRGGQ